MYEYCQSSSGLKNQRTSASIRESWSTFISASEKGGETTMKFVSIKTATRRLLRISIPALLILPVGCDLASQVSETIGANGARV